MLISHITSCLEYSSLPAYSVTLGNTIIGIAAEGKGSRHVFVQVLAL